MYVRILRFEDIPYLMSLGRNKKTVKGWERILKRGCSIGVFRGEQILSYILTVRKKKDNRMEIPEFYSSSISASVLMWADYLHRFSEPTIEYTGRTTDLTRLIPAIERFTEGVHLIQRDGLIEVTTADFRFISYHMVILERLTNQFSMFNVGIRLVVYELLKNMPIEEVAKRKRHIIQAIHRRNKERLNQISPDFQMASVTLQPTTEVMRNSYEERLQADGYRKYSSHANVPGWRPSGFNYLIGGNHFFGTKENQLERVQLFKMTSRYQKLTYAFYRNQLSFIQKAHEKEEKKTEWLLLDRQGYEYLKVSKMPYIYHLIPRNFQTIFDASVRDVLFFQNIIEKLNNQLGEDLTLKGFFERNIKLEDYPGEEEYSAYSLRENRYNFIHYLGVVKRTIGVTATKKLVSEIFASPNLSSITYEVADRIKMAVSSRVLTNKAIYLFVSPAMDSEKRRAIGRFLNSMNVLNNEPDSLFQPANIRKGISKVLKQEEQSKECFDDYYFSHMLDSLFSNRVYSEKGERLVRDIIENEFRKILPERSYSVIYQSVREIFIKPVNSNEDWYLETIKEIFVRYWRKELIQASGHHKYLFNTYISVRKRLGEDFFLVFLEKWRGELRNAEYPASFIHDTGYIYDDFITLFDGLSDVAIMKGLMETPIKKLHAYYQEVKQMLRTMKEAGLSSKENLVYEQLDESLSKGGNVDDLNLFNDHKFLHAAFKRYGVEEEEVSAVQTFVERLSRYNHRINALSFLSLFKKRSVEFVRGTYNGLFTERVFELPNDELAELLRAALGNKETRGIVAHPRKLFTKISKLGDVQSFIRGDIPSEMVQPIVSLLKQVRLDIPQEVHLSTRYQGVIERKGSPEFLIAGNASVCCMSFGEDNAYDYAVREGFGIFNVYYNGRIIANSVLWINELDDSLVIDNIEVHPNYETSNPFIKKLYFQMIEDVLNRYNLKRAVQGGAYNDLDLNDKGVPFKHKYKGKETGNAFYTDADYVVQVYPLKVKDKPSSKDKQSLIAVN